MLRKLLGEADVLVESEAPGVMAARELGYEQLKDDFPDLVYCSVTPFGQTGPYSSFKGNSLTAMALSGLMYITGDPDKEPLCTGGEPAEYFGALHAWVAILAALEHRAKTGAGQHIDVSMLEALGCADEYNTTMYAYLGAIRRRFYSRHAIPTYPSEIFPCRDGNIVVIGGATGFPLMMAILIEQPELENNPLFQNLWLRFMQWQQFEEILRPYLAEHDWEDLPDARAGAAHPVRRRPRRADAARERAPARARLLRGGRAPGAGQGARSRAIRSRCPRRR